MSQIIAFIGKKRSGKDIATNYLCNMYDFVPMKVAQGLKDGVKVMFGLTDDQIEGSVKEVNDARYGVTPRQIMQFVGTEMMQYKLQELIPGIGRSFWIRKLCETIKQKHPNKNIAISDVRFCHEVDELRKEFGTNVLIVRICRPCIPDNDLHISEQEYKNIIPDFTIINDSSIEHFHHQLDKILDQINE